MGTGGGPAVLIEEDSSMDKLVDKVLADQMPLDDIPDDDDIFGEWCYHIFWCVRYSFNIKYILHFLFFIFLQMNQDKCQPRQMCPPQMFRPLVPTKCCPQPGAAPPSTPPPASTLVSLIQPYLVCIYCLNISMEWLLHDLCNLNFRLFPRSTGKKKANFIKIGCGNL